MIHKIKLLYERCVSCKRDRTISDINCLTWKSLYTLLENKIWKIDCLFFAEGGNLIYDSSINHTKYIYISANDFYNYTKLYFKYNIICFWISDIFPYNIPYNTI